MKQFCFTGVPQGLREGLSAVAQMLGISLSAQGSPIAVSTSSDGTLRVSDREISYAEPVQFFRALGLLAEHWDARPFSICETPQFDTNGIMLDLCQGNDTMTVKHLKHILTRMAIMGLNTFYFYIEDSYEIEGEPFFGYLRGRYTQAEMREADAFANALGITIIPCIQTLAHLHDALKWAPYAEFQDDHDTLLVGDERTYALIRKMLKTIQSAFSSKKIHIGLDEAWRLGQGNYLLKNGYRKKYDIMLEHLNRVLGICEELGIEAMIWSDMFMKAANQNEDPNSDYYQIEGEVPQEMIDTVPRNVDFVYWNYGNTDEARYAAHIERHFKFTDRLVFAGGIWNWTSFTVDYDRTFVTTNAALAACKKTGLRNVFATTWGDGGAERNVYEILLGMQLFAEHGYAQEISEEKLKARFYACTGCHYEDFRVMTHLDNPYGLELVDAYDFVASSSYLMWQDVMLGMFDQNTEGLNMTRQYEEVYEKLCLAATRNGEYNYVFDFLAKVADVLRIKAELGKRIKSAYDKKDTSALTACISDLKEAAKRAETLYQTHRDWWFEINKPFGFEVFDVRYGGLIKMLERGALRLEQYLNGTVARLEELEVTRLPFNGKEGPVHNLLQYPTMITAGHLKVE